MHKEKSCRKQKYCLQKQVYGICFSFVIRNYFELMNLFFILIAILSSYWIFVMCAYLKQYFNSPILIKFLFILSLNRIFLFVATGITSFDIFWLRQAVSPNECLIVVIKFFLIISVLPARTLPFVCIVLRKSWI